MNLSTLTIGDIKGLVPRQLTGRYHPTQWPINRFNQISSHIEQYCDIDYMTEQLILPMQDMINRYPLYDRIRQMRGVYEIPINMVDNRYRTISSSQYIPEIRPDKDNPIRFDVFGNTLDVGVTPSESEPILEEDRDIVDSTGSTIQKLFDVDASGPLETEENLRGKGVIITHDSGVVDHMIIAKNDGTANSFTVNGEMSAIPNDDTVYSIYNRFWILESAIYLTRLNINGALTQLISVPVDFEETYRTGIFWQYYAQEGENKVEIDRYQNLFEAQIKRFTSDQNRFRSDNKITIPRKVPRVFPGSNR